MIWIILFVILTYFLIIILKLPHPYYNLSLKDMDKYLYVLLYRGYADESFGKAQICLYLYKYSFSAEAYIVKYKRRGVPQLSISLIFKEDELKKELVLKKRLNEKNIRYIITDREKKIRVYEIDMKTDIKLIKEMVRFIWEEVFEMELRFNLHFYDICLNPNKIIDYEDTKELEEKGIDIRIPVVMWQGILQKLGMWKR